MAPSKGGKSSKTARASTRAGSGSGSNSFIKSADTPVFIPTGAGAYAYVATADGKTIHVQVVSEKMTAALGELTKAGLGERALAEAKQHAALFPAWSSVVEHLTPEPEMADA